MTALAQHNRLTLLSTLIAACVAVAACGGGGGGSPDDTLNSFETAEARGGKKGPTASPTPSPAPAPAPEPAPAPAPAPEPAPAPAPEPAPAPAPATSPASGQACGPDIGGWTVPVPTVASTNVPLRDMSQPGSRLMYISAATGNDSTAEVYFWNGTSIIDSKGSAAAADGRAYGTDPMNPSAAVKPFKRWSYVAPRRNASQDIGSIGLVGTERPNARAGFPDWWLFKRGETFDLAQDFLSFAQESNPTATVAKGSLTVPGGRSSAERQIVGAYGDVCQSRPRFIHPTLGFVTRWAVAGEAIFKNVAYLSLHFDGHDRPAGGDYRGITMLYQGQESTDILFEDVWLDAAMVTVSQRNGAQVTFRRALMTDAFATDGGKVQGIFYEGSRVGRLRIEESILLRNGFSRGDPKTMAWPPTGTQTWNVFNRNMYLSGETNSMQSGVFDTVSMLGASGDQFRPGMKLERNFFYQGYVTMGAYGGYADTDGATGSIVDNVLQRFKASGTNDNNGHPGWGIGLGSGAYGVEVARNIVTGAQHAGVDAAFGLAPLSWYCYSHTFKYATRGNLIRGNIFEAGNSASAVTVQDGVVNEETAGCSNWRFPGVSGNKIADNVLINPSLKESAYQAIGSAVGTASDTAYERNNLFATRAAAASTLGWKDPNRTLKTYMQANGVSVSSTDGFPEYFDRATQQRRGQWRPEWTSRALLNHVRDGFNVPALP